MSSTSRRRSDPTPVSSLLKSARQALDKEISLPHQASSLAKDLFRLTVVHQLAEDPRVRPMVLRFWEVLPRLECPNLLESQIAYALRIANLSHSPILPEEMYKLFSLCDEIYALQALGLRVEAELYAEFQETLRARFRRQKRDAGIVASRFVDDWSRGLWWYAENL